MENIYQGSRRQRGGALFSTIARVAIPLLKKRGKNLALSLGRRGLKTGAALLRSRLNRPTAGGVVAPPSVAADIKEQLRSQAGELLDGAEKRALGLLTSQDGEGLRRRRKKKAKKASAGPRRASSRPAKPSQGSAKKKGARRGTAGGKKKKQQRGGLAINKRRRASTVRVPLDIFS